MQFLGNQYFDPQRFKIMATDRCDASLRSDHQPERTEMLSNRPMFSIQSLLSLPLLVAFGLFSSPARAMPAASMQLFRLDRHGVKPLPAVSALLEGVPAGGTAQSAPAAARAASPTPDSKLVAQLDASAAGLAELRQSFVSRLPSNLSGNIRLMSIAEDGTLGGVVEEIPFNSPNISFSADRTQLIVRPTTPIAPGQSVMLQLPSRSPSGVRFFYPNHLTSTPCIFKATAVSSVPAAVAPAAAASTFPTWAVILGVVVVGVGVAAATGAFNGDAGTNTSSQ